MKNFFTGLIALCVTVLLLCTVAMTPAAAKDRPSCDAPFAVKFLAGGCNSVVGVEHEFTPMNERSHPVSEPVAEEKADEPSEPSESGTEDGGDTSTDDGGSHEPA